MMMQRIREDPQHQRKHAGDCWLTQAGKVFSLCRMSQEQFTGVKFWPSVQLVYRCIPGRSEVALCPAEFTQHDFCDAVCEFFQLWLWMRARSIAETARTA
eukprot:5496360-Pleurochrysis_carterae.AAC.1